MLAVPVHREPKCARSVLRLKKSYEVLLEIQNPVMEVGFIPAVCTMSCYGEGAVIGLGCT